MSEAPDTPTIATSITNINEIKEILPNVRFFFIPESSFFTSPDPTLPVQ
ncbi:MAG: hypothetical protein PHF57_04445 [Methanoregula sp.]|nr:hypothetical protein [Methanoregula sp.]